MSSRNPVYPLPQGAFSVHINGDHNQVSRYKYTYGNHINFTPIHFSSYGNLKVIFETKSHLDIFQYLYTRFAGC